MTDVLTYEQRIAAQIEQFRQGVNLHALPDIFHYWAHNYLRPKINDIFEVDGIADFFASPIAAIARSRNGEAIQILSVGSGDCSVDIMVADALIKQGVSEFTIHATELSPVLIEQANQAISGAKLTDHIRCVEVDLNRWSPPSAAFDAAFASHSLHHIENLEHLFAAIRQSLKPGAVFCVSDMIGRNGHMRWPETLEIFQKFWAILPESHRYNRLLSRLELTYINHDCSTQGFEGIRAQDILPLLLVNFYPGRFLTVGGLTDILLDRAFGHNFDPQNDFDRNFIDLVHMVNEKFLEAGIITPTQLLAYFHVEPSNVITWKDIGPERSIRWPYGRG